MSRGTVSGNGIVTSGLVLCLDAANPRSYVSGSTEWSDLTSNRNNSTLNNGPTFSNANGGILVFDGTDDYAEIQHNSLLNPSLSMTLSAWINIKVFESNMAICGKGTQTPGSGGFDFRINTNSQLNLVKYFITDQTVNIPTLIVNTWYNISAVQSSTRVDYYINGNSVGFYSNSSAYQTNNTTFKIALDRTTIYMRADIPQIAFYNRALSAAEILQNYNSTKARFGL